MDVGAALAAHGQTPVLMQQGEGPLDDPPPTVTLSRVPHRGMWPVMRRYRSS
nr:MULTISPECIES: hypothetical protein [Nocardia]